MRRPRRRPDGRPPPAALLDSKILFNTAARDASATNAVVGLGAAAPRFDDAALTGRVPGSVVSTSREASYVACSTCHADFGGHDGRTWDFSQFGAALRNTIDLRGRAGFAPGTCSNEHDGSAHTLLDVVRPCDTTVDDCLEAGRGRNLNGRHGVTSILTPQQLNDLIAFQKTLTLATIVGTNGRVISAGALDLSRVVLQFGKPQRLAQHRAIAKFRLKGALRGAPRPIDPTKNPVTLSVATPQGEQMAIFARTLTLRGRGRWLVGHSAVEGGVVTVALTPSGGGYRLRAKGRRLDLSALAPDAGDPRSRDLTVAIEVSGATFVRNRLIAFERGVFKLSRPRA